MPYQNDAETAYRIIRQSLLSSASRLYQHETPDPDKVLAVAKEWEKWIYEPLPGAASPATNGTTVATPATLLCAECHNPVGDVSFKDGKRWSTEELANRGIAKFGRALCKTHYFARKA
jgi:hypothetical protein